MSEGMNYTIYINNVPHNCTDPFTGCFYADHPSLPRRYCSQHNIGMQAAMLLKTNHAVFTLGNRYSMVPPVQVQDVEPKPPAKMQANPDVTEMHWRDKLIVLACIIGLVAVFMDIFVWRAY